MGFIMGFYNILKRIGFRNKRQDDGAFSEKLEYFVGKSCQTCSFSQNLVRNR